MHVDLAKPKSRQRFRVVGLAISFVAVLGIVAPFINAARFSQGIQDALEESLGRKVNFENAYYRLFPLPGFSLEKVTIHEDPHYGLEPFAYARSLQARLRIDKLLFGQIRFTTLHLVEPSLNLVKRDDGTWNVVELISRLSSPSRLPANLFPAIEVSDGRIDFKFGTRKTTLYITECDISIYLKRSGRIGIQFSGSPARTDRAGNGFGHVRGNVNWYLNPLGEKANQLEADVTLDPSNLSELTTLIEGHDIGVHGRIGSRAHIAGPASALGVTGELNLEDVHRWDLLPSSGEEWRVNYSGVIDLHAHRLALQTLPLHPGEVVPVALQVRVNDFLTSPAWSIFATLQKAPVQPLPPLGRRMGLALPSGLELSGSLDGVVGYSNTSGLAGGIAITNATAKVADIPTVRSAFANIQISNENIHLAPAILDAGAGGTLRVGGEFSLSTQRLLVTVNADQVAIGTLVNTTQAWFGAPKALAALNDGYVTGQFAYTSEGVTSPKLAKPSGWSGQFDFLNASLIAPGLAGSLKHAQGHAFFSPSNFDLPHFSAIFDQQPISGSYHYNVAAKRPERLHVELASADLTRISAALDPVFSDRGLLERLRFTKRSIPPWLAARNLEGDIAVGRLSVNKMDLGALSAHFLWQATNLQFSPLQLHLTEGSLKATGSINVSTYSPRLQLSVTATGFRWGGGSVTAEGEVQTSGTGADSLRNLRATGTFSGEDVSLSDSESFQTLSGQFTFSFSDEWPDLRLSRIRAVKEEEEWSGEATSRSDGKLVFDLENGGRQLHVISPLTSQKKQSPASLVEQPNCCSVIGHDLPTLNNRIRLSAEFKTSYSIKMTSRIKLDNPMHALEPAWEDIKRQFATACVQSARAARSQVTYELNQLLRRLCQYESEGGWARLVVEGAGAFCRQAAVFVLEGDLLHLRAEVNLEVAEILSFSPSCAGAFETVWSSKETVTALRIPSEVTDALSTRNSGERAHVLPITNGSRLAAALFVSDDDDTDLNALEMIAGIASAVLERQSNTQLLSQIAISQEPAKLTFSESPPNGSLDSNPPARNPDNLIQISGSASGRYPAESIEAAVSASGSAIHQSPLKFISPARITMLPAWADLDEIQRQLHMRAQRFARVTVAEMQLAKTDECRAGREKGDFYLFLNKEIDRAREIYRKQFMTISSMVDYLHLELVQTAVQGDERKLGADYPGQLV